MSIWRSPSSRNWSIWFCNLWGQFLSDYTLLYIFGKLWRFRFFWWLFCSISMCIRRLMSVSRLSKFQAFISRHQSYFEIFEVSFNPITIFYTLLESHVDCASFHGSLAQFQLVLAKICAFEICLSSKHSFQDNNLILQCLRSVLIQLPCSTHCWKDILIVLLLVVVLPNSSLYWHRYVHLKVA